PQTRFVLGKALEKGLKTVLVINKVDRPTTNIKEAIRKTQDLFLELATTSEQLDFPVIYASARKGWAAEEPGVEGTSLVPLFEAIVKHIPPPVIEEGPFQMLVSNLDYDSHVGRLVIGRIFRGKEARNDMAVVIDIEGKLNQYKIKGVYNHLGLQRLEVEEASAGEIVALVGLEKASIGDTVAAPEKPEVLPRIDVGEPTVKMTFGVNTSPFGGREGKFCTSRQIRDRLYKELERNVSLQVTDTNNANVFLVAGRGELHLAILIETMRREGYELEVSKPEAIYKEIDGKLMEPIEYLVIDTREQYVGVITEIAAARLAQMQNMFNDGKGNVRMEFNIPTRGLIGFHSAFIMAVRGEGVM
ncbi:MAG: GTP-binding protein, partial [Dehalococcoidia bacterium]|nr:GTP-binding protein [Dehalococcoidia bacterium]